MTPRRVEATLFAALVVAMHALLLWAWPEPQRSHRGATPDIIVLTAPISKQPLPTAPPPALPPVATQRNDVRPRAATSRATPTLSKPMTEPAAVASMPEPASAVASAPSAAASQPLDLRLRLSPAMARRGGLTEPTGSMRAQALNDPRSNQEADPRQRLPDAVAASAKGDCLKGEYAGWGMGLFSVPFLAYHAVAGNCKPLR
jgi:hypothetical protein